MSKSNQLALLSSMSVGANVGMEEVVSIFVCRLEEDLHNQRKSGQAALVKLNGEIKSLTTQLLSTMSVVIKSVERVVEDEFVSITVSVNPKNEPTVSWEDGLVTYLIHQQMDSKRVNKKYGGNNTSGYVYVALPIDDGIKSAYDSLMAEKAKVTDRLNQVNAELRDLSRRERAVRAKVAEMKLNEAGMGDLLNNNELLQLVNTDNIIEG